MATVALAALFSISLAQDEVGVPPSSPTVKTVDGQIISCASRVGVVGGKLVLSGSWASLTCKDASGQTFTYTFPENQVLEVIQWK
jgi:hypothetical protein